MENGADIHGKTTNGERPREIAVRYNQAECVDFLDWAGELHIHYNKNHDIYTLWPYQLKIGIKVCQLVEPLWQSELGPLMGNPQCHMSV